MILNCSCETVYRSEHMDPPQHHPTPEEQDYKKTKLEIQQKKKKKNRGLKIYK